jgi:hypothetical protein
MTRIPRPLSGKLTRVLRPEVSGWLVKRPEGIRDDFWRHFLPTGVGIAHKLISPIAVGVQKIELGEIPGVVQGNRANELFQAI